MAKKKKTRKQLLKEPDEFLTFTQSLMRYVLEHRVQIAAGLGVLFAIVIVVSGVLYFSEKAENRAFTMMNSAMEKYNALSEEEGPEKAYQAVNEEFQTILEKYGDKDGGKLARIAYGDIAFEAGAYDRAIELYERALRDADSYPSLKNFILAGLAYSYEGNGDLASAVRYFEMITAGTTPLMKAEAFFNLGRIYAETGNPEKSAQAYETLIAEYPDATYIDLVKERVAKTAAAESSPT
ncbi:MAG: tetratricopeptide repeat protein [Thermodesulfobacteriota bacterium]